MMTVEKKRQMYLSILKDTPRLYNVVAEQRETNPAYTLEQDGYLTVFLPAMVHFVEWTLADAARRKIERLYFLARDAYQFYLLADAICKARNLAIDCRYLEGSRVAWRTPEYHLIGVQAIEKICIGGIHVTLEKILRRGGLTEEECRKAAEEMGMQDRLREELSYAQTRKLQEALEHNQTLLTCMGRHSREAYQVTEEYFRQEGLFDDVPYALVDSGWTGSLQQTLTNLLEAFDHRGRQGIEGYYFGMYELPRGVDTSLYHTFFFSRETGLLRKAEFSNCLFEAIFTAPCGMTCGYRRQEDGRIVPVKETGENLNRERIEDNLKVLGQFIARYCNLREGIIPSSKQVRRLFRQLMRYPCLEEAECFGGYLFSDDVWSTSQQKVAADLTDEEIRNQHLIHKMLVMTGIKKGTLKNSAWMEGSIVKNGKRVRTNLLHAYWYKVFIYVRKRMKVG